MKLLIIRMILAALLLTGCAGFQRDCNSGMAQSFGGDWIIVQYKFDGSPINCWKLVSSPVSSEEHSDGIFWQDPQGHLVHISGWYNRIQVSSGRWDDAAKTLGVDSAKCRGGAYQQ